MLKGPFRRIFSGIRSKTHYRHLSSTGGCCKCTKCSNVLSNGLGLIKCGRCGSFQPAPPTRAEPSCCPNYYKLLLPPDSPAEEEPKFDIDLKRLKEEYLKLQGAVHPDRLNSSLGDSWSSWINRAHSTLKDPLQRAIYLVHLHEKSHMDDETIISNNEGIHDISLVLEVREELDATSDPQALLRLKTENDLRIKECCRELSKVLGREFDGRRARECINSLRYWMSIDRQLQEK